ncbi:MAG: O-antigen ligase family protein [Anaerolineales bacterium]|nr:O-antigen ligase family protein [Anaerolineales bacterium]
MKFLAQVQRLAKFLAQYEIWPVALGIVASMVWPCFLPAAVITAAFFWVVRWIAYGRPSVRTPADWPIALLLVMVGVTLWISPLPEKTSLQAARLVSGVALYYAIANWTNTFKRLRLALNGIALAGLGLALIAPFSVTWSTEKLPFIPVGIYQRFAVLISDAAHPNVMAGILLLLFPIALCGLLFAWSELGWLERVLLAVGSVSMLGVLVLSQSRGAWIALAVILAAVPLLRWRWGLVLVSLGIGSAVSLVYLLGAAKVIRAFTVHSTIGGRFATWQRAIYMIEDFPFTGIGMGAFLETLDHIYPFYPPDTVKMYHAHNLFLQIAVDLGIPGLIAWLAILIGIVWLSWQLYSHGRIHKQKYALGLGAGLLCSQLALSAHGLVDAVTWGMVRPAPIVWAIWGMVVVSWKVTSGASISSNKQSD